VPCPHYSVCWSALERYEPLSAKALAARHESRERNKAERAEKKWAKDNPLLAWAKAVRAEEETKEQKPGKAPG
jgi:hypothetical protein